MATDRTAVVFTLIGTLAGSMVTGFIDYAKTTRMRHTEARIKAVELAWNQSADAFQRLWAIRARLRADLWSYRDAEIYTRYYNASFNRHHDRRDSDRETYYRKTIDDYAMRVVEDRAQLAAVLAWFTYALPQQANPATAEMAALNNLNAWQPQDPPPGSNTLDDWLKKQRASADQGAVAEIEEKFGNLETKLKQHQMELLHESTRRYIAVLSEAE